MKFNILLIVAFSIITLISFEQARSEPSFNGTAPGCGGGSCHSTASGIVTVQVLTNNQIRVTVSGTTSNVGGELVDSTGQVVTVINSTSNNPFTLTAPGQGTYTVNAGYKNPNLRWSSVNVSINVTGIDDILIGSKPSNYELYSNYPNPFNPTTTIRYAIPQTSYTTLKIFNLAGEQVAVLIKEVKQAGVYEIKYNAESLPSGFYFYKLESGNFSETKKMLLLK